MSGAERSGTWHALAAPLRGPHALSFAPWLATLPGASLMTVSLTPGRSGGSYLGWTALGALSHLLCGLLLWLARPVASRPSAHARAPFVLAVIVLAGIVRGASLGWASEALGWADGRYLDVRIPAATISLAFWYLLAALLIDGSRRHRDAMAEVRAQVEAQEELLQHSTEWVEAFRADTVAQTRRVVAAQLEGALTLSANPERAAAHLREVVDTVVRPLSHLLQQRTIVEEGLLRPFRTGQSRPRLPAQEYLDRMAGAPAFVPAASATLVVATSAPLSIHLLGPAVAVAGLATTGALVAACLQYGRQRLAPLLRGRPLPQRLAAVLGTWVATASVSGGLMMAIVSTAHVGAVDWSQDAATQRLLSFTASSLLVLGSAAAAAAEATVRDARRVTAIRLRQSSERLRWATARARQSAWVEQQQLGRLLHGDTQARIVSMALQLQLQPPADVGAAIAGLADDIDRALSGDPLADWNDVMTQVNALWSGVIEMRWQVPDAARSALQADPTAARATAEVVREGILNAVRHGNARTVTVSIAITGPLLRVHVDDDGTGVAANARPGLGQAVLAAVCLDWSLTSTTSGARLSARIPTAHPLPHTSEPAHA